MQPSSLKYAAVFACLAVASAGAAVYTAGEVGAYLLVMTAAAFGVVAAAYASRQPGLLGKRPDGRLRLLPMLVLLPYHLISVATFYLYRFADRGAPWARVDDRLLWGRRLTAAEAGALQATHVLDLTCEFFESAPLRGRSYQCIGMLDGTSPSMEQLESAVDWLGTSLQTGPTYVHCALGHGRSGLVVLAYLIETGRFTSVDEAQAWARSVRPKATLSRGQQELLRQWALRCRPAAG